MDALQHNLHMLLKSNIQPSRSALEPYLREICTLAGGQKNARNSDTSDAPQHILHELMNFMIRILSDPKSANNRAMTADLCCTVCGACAFLCENTSATPIADASLFGVLHVGYVQLRHIEDTGSQLMGSPFPLTMESWNAFHPNDSFLWLCVCILLKPGHMFLENNAVPDLLLFEVLSLIDFVFGHAVKSSSLSHYMNHFPFVHLEIPTPGQLLPYSQLNFAQLLSHVLEIMKSTKPLREPMVVLVVRVITRTLLLHASGVIPSPVASLQSYDVIYHLLWSTLLDSTKLALSPEIQYRIVHLLFLWAVVPGDHEWLPSAFQQAIVRFKPTDTKAFERNIALSIYEVHYFLTMFDTACEGGTRAKETQVWTLFNQIFRESEFPIVSAILSKLLIALQNPSILCFTFITQCYVMLADTKESLPLGAQLGNVSCLMRPLQHPNPELIRTEILEIMCQLSWTKPIFFYMHKCLGFCRELNALNEDELFGEFCAGLALCVEDQGLSMFVSSYIIQFSAGDRPHHYLKMYNRLVW
eukprot:PhF_6_TR4859/c0_g1_i1/m.6813